ncbi:hypothetical protein [Kibdelosporangium phytohabitans]|uniref:Uncharacterized protein n=1 Tax=Kibdelosporangium phytohabitans TaxID=860235 RepID=A0A0N9HQ85_9PSEU|nr:hypothetical protein [Kibdelosporangium phytohabitans]ALG09274.1 hypothetical protein AOZ06_22290 [Kibdelosporangium phytohabitans]MBE1469478.1 hypothetical protein [Kibdelosporangium phytohabitans]
MSDLVAYYVETSPWPEPALYRRRPDAQGGGRVDESFVPRDGTWRRSSGLRKHESGQADWDLYGIDPAEAEQVMAYKRRLAAGDGDDAGRSPVLGEWGVGDAWIVKLTGTLSEAVVDEIVDRLGMTRRAPLSPGERDLALRVLRSDSEARWNFELYRTDDDETLYLRLRYLRLVPGERVIQALRDQVFPLAGELGLEIVDEQVMRQPSYPYSARARAELLPDKDLLLVLWFRGAMTEGMLQTLQQQLGLRPEWSSDVDESTELEWGAGYLPNDGRYRAQLRLRRTFNDDDLWRFEIGYEGKRPPEETIDQWRDEITAAATGAGLRFERDWLRPRPAPESRTPLLPAPTRTAGQVHVLYRAYLSGGFTAESLDSFRDALGIEKRGRIGDDSEQYFGERVLREGDNRLVRLMLARSSANSWYVSLSYQDTPPDPATVDQIAREVHAAATAAGLTIGYEQRFPPKRP